MRATRSHVTLTGRGHRLQKVRRHRLGFAHRRHGDEIHWRPTGKNQPSKSFKKDYCFRGFFRYLVRRKIVTENHFEEIQFNHLLRKLPNVLTIGEMTRLLNSIRQPVTALEAIPNEEGFLTVRDKAMLEVLFSTALRVSELVGLNWRDIQYQARQVCVTGKGNKMRLSPLGQPALDALVIYARAYQWHWKNKPEGLEPGFLSMWNRRIETRSTPRTIKKWADRAGIHKRVNAHCFRHSAAVAMLEGGADLRAIQQMLGHASIATTELYTRVSTKRLRAIHAQSHPRA
jgi:integrase/recombinase XerD